jgi:hypothetical protein
VIPNAAGLCGSVFSYSRPPVTDNCGVARVELIRGRPSGTFFPVGTSTLTWKATDINGNVSNFVQSIVVTDVQKPTIVAPPAVSTVADRGKMRYSSFNLGSPQTADNCGVSTVTNNAQFPIPLGTTIVTWTVTDIHGNVNTATQSVVVSDDQPPIISGTTRPNLCNNSSGVYNIEPITVSDNM